MPVPVTPVWCARAESNRQTLGSRPSRYASSRHSRMVASEGLEPSPFRVRTGRAAANTSKRWSRHSGSNRDLVPTKHACAPCTPWRLERAAGFEPALQGLEGPAATVASCSHGGQGGDRTHRDGKPPTGLQPAGTPLSRPARSGAAIGDRTRSSTLARSRATGTP